MTHFCDVCDIYVEFMWVRDHIHFSGRRYEVYACPICQYEIAFAVA